MADVFNKTTREVRRNVNTPDYPTADWVVRSAKSPKPGWEDLETRSVPFKHWKVSGEDLAEMTQGEKDTVDSSELVDLKVSHYLALVEQSRGYFDRRYPPERQANLAMLYAEAKTKVVPDLTTANYVQGWWNWKLTVMNEVRSKRAQINAATNAAQVLAVTVDFQSFNASDPLVTVEQALNLRGA